MNVLAIDSSGTVASVAIMNADDLVGEFTIHNKLTHSQTLLPMIDAVFSMSGLRIQDMDAVAVSAGPGSFTGLRIGAATAKGLCQAAGLPIIPVPTLEALAFHMSDTNSLVCPIMDARRNQVYTGIYRFKDKKPHEILEQCAMSMDDLIEKINELGQSVIFVGDGIEVFKEIIQSKLTIDHSFADPEKRLQRAANVASLASRHEKIPAKEFAPTYLRLSQAERERMKNNQ